MTTVVGGRAEPFLTFVAGAAKEATAGQRLIEIRGRDAGGESFTRKVSLCPRPFDHKAAVQKTLEAARSAR